MSWLMIEQGWSVVDASGEDVGTVEETVGDSTHDIFNGVTFGTSLLGKARYVPAEHVAEITEGQVQLALTRDAIERLPPYEQPPGSEQILAP